jgi:hypothetical protein
MKLEPRVPEENTEPLTDGERTVNPCPMTDPNEGRGGTASQTWSEPLEGCWSGRGSFEFQSPISLTYETRSRGGGCAVNEVLVLTGGGPVNAIHTITTIMMDLSEPRGEVTRSGVSDEPIVIVKRSADDLHGDMRRGENRAKVQPMSSSWKEDGCGDEGGNKQEGKHLQSCRQTRSRKASAKAMADHRELGSTTYWCLRKATGGRLPTLTYQPIGNDE